MSTIKKHIAGNLKISIAEDRQTMGREAAHEVAERIKKVSAEKESIRMVFAAAVSQKEFFEELLEFDDIPWQKVIAFHMDEYHTITNEAPQRFGNFLKEHLFQYKPFGAVHYIQSNFETYSNLISEADIDIICLGIGENGHLAFNDPPVADFKDPEVFKEVKLDEICRQQQVNDGQFKTLDEVPQTAVTLTIPTLMKADYLSVVVPGSAKAKAVAKTVFHPVSTECPSTVLRLHPNAKLYLDTHSSKNIMEKLS
ncbi:6-phosphogluconolactonase [Gracilimonas sp.]|uniref:6-phosphogluconolactonase n=1 Tax=Gracilimonas sp. TaxID=1974203 RepID=UPI0032EDD884